MSVDAWATWGIVSFILLIVSLYFFIFSKQIMWKKDRLHFRDYLFNNHSML